MNAGEVSNGELSNGELSTDASNTGDSSNGDCSPVRVRDGRLGKSVFVTREVQAGEPLVRCAGKLVPVRTQHSIQIDLDQHLDVEAPVRFLNHSCEPNCGLLIRRGARYLDLHALRCIAAGEELTLDYATFEWEIHFMPGPCLCGAPTCRGRVRGFKDLLPAQIDAYGPYVAEYLQQMALVAGK